MTQIKERPILFSAPMVRAILEGHKTVTRRPVKGQALKWLADFTPDYVADPENRLCPYGYPGDRLWVRETWAQPSNLDPAPTVYRATYPDCLKGEGWENLPPIDAIRWKPSIHMFRRDSRILLEITAVRVERLQDISERDCIAEGVGLTPNAEGMKLTIPLGASLAKTWFSGYWESINGPGSLEANPWVWVVEFKRVAR